MSDSESRLAYLADTVDLLWPAAGGTSEPAMVTLPSTHKPRLLVPVRPRRAAAAAAIRYTAQQSVLDRARGLALAGGVIAGVCTRLQPVRTSRPDPDTESIDEHLSRVLDRQVISALALSRARANRKPVLQVFDNRGRTIAFAKVGTNRLTRALVDNEAAGLMSLGHSTLDGVRVPEVLHHGSWRSTTILVTSPLPLGLPVRGLPTVVDRAMNSIFHSGGRQQGDASSYLSRIRAETNTATGSEHRDPTRISRWLELLDAVVGWFPTDELDVGAWHGDWTAWNCTMRRGLVHVWDWERYAVGVPAGFDKLHYVLNQAVERGREGFPQAARKLVETSPALLASWGVGHRAAQATALLYILHLAQRYLCDDPHGHATYARVENWAFPIVETTLRAARS